MALEVLRCGFWVLIHRIAESLRNICCAPPLSMYGLEILKAGARRGNKHNVSGPKQGGELEC